MAVAHEILRVEVICPMCKIPGIILVPTQGYEAWRAGAFVQDALPMLDASTRERLISGTCGPCWERMFPDLECECDGFYEAGTCEHV